MDIFSFYDYDKKEEEPNGNYHKFILASNEEIDKLNANIYDLCKIVLQIQDFDLKKKMKERIIKYIKSKDLLYTGDYFLSCGLFSDDEIKDIVSSTSYIEKIQDKISKDNLREYYVLEIIQIYFHSTDKEWILKNISEILLHVKNCDFYQTLLVSTMELSFEKDKELFRELLNTCKSSIPKYYLNYLNINADSEYLYNKSMEYRNQHLKIGIDPRISIAPEIEANNYNNLTIDFYSQKDFNGGKYRNHNDATVPNGKEINCIPFHDTEEDLASFKAVCDSLKDIGYYYDTISGNASGQINLGLSYLDSAAAIINFYEIFGNVEELLFYISNKKGDLTRQSLYQNSRFKPIGEILGKRIIDEDITREDVIKLFNATLTNDAGISGLTYKKNTVCLRGNNEEDYRFEIRIPNGGVDYEVWIDNIRLYGKMMEVSKKLADATKKDYLTTEEERMLNLKYELEDDTLSLEEKLTLLMDLLFTDKQTKAIYYERFNSVKERLRNTYDYDERNKYYVPKNPKEKMFDVVEFTGQYKSNLGIEGQVAASYDPTTDEYLEGKKPNSR